ncbi:hypothetical protein Q1695_004280 [Nippostrongylus brasiliensis]|nr:hypothetical protein Q1695_004280 [Nippostrongylus brasiliensis]
MSSGKSSKIISSKSSMRLVGFVVAVFLLFGYSDAGRETEHLQLTNDIRRFGPMESSYLFPYLVRRLPFPRLTLRSSIIKQIKKAPLIKY